MMAGAPGRYGKTLKEKMKTDGGGEQMGADESCHSGWGGQSLGDALAPKQASPLSTRNAGNESKSSTLFWTLR